ncbi:hypothetical protein M433DRAFT_177873 [Acidomyces richmondensis BFW]|nr:MAG: hypothetical protein FE78DRAFT_29224 [Acidomyces sp. 'richmondensis']KYG40653.1 hypothetical protein M433DRAFT_177873 [Acidomyces richmondensis BFW]
MNQRFLGWLFRLLICTVLVSAIEIISTPSASDLSLGNEFVLSWESDHFTIKKGSVNIWSTVPGKPFVSADGHHNSGKTSNDSSNPQTFEFGCKSQNVLSFQYVDWKETFTGTAVQVRGQLLRCQNMATTYLLTFWVPSMNPDRVAFRLDVSPLHNPNVILNNLCFRFAMHPHDTLYGFDWNGPFTLPNNNSMTITSIIHDNLPAVNGVNETYSSDEDIGGAGGTLAYITTSGRLFYLYNSSTAHAKFDFTVKNVVSIEYGSLIMNGAFAKGADLFDASAKLTAATGRTLLQLEQVS